jgi:hypothetical protein
MEELPILQRKKVGTEMRDDNTPGCPEADFD